jgi:beta-phosphoglucomutase-like phosphatase (HAD superfamily)
MEDAPAGVASAKAAGMKCLAVGTSNPLENLRAADLVTPTLEDLNEKDITKLLAG